MKSLVYVAALSVIFYISVVNATSPPVCVYEALDGHAEFLPYFTAVREGKSYVDYGAQKEGACVQRGTCTESYEAKIEKCLDFEVTCENKHTFEGEFPACCAQC